MKRFGGSGFGCLGYGQSFVSAFRTWVLWFRGWRALDLGVSGLKHRFTRKVDVRLPGNGNSNFHGARPVHFIIITMMKWTRTSRTSIKNCLSLEGIQG